MNFDFEERKSVEEHGPELSSKAERDEMSFKNCRTNEANWEHISDAVVASESMIRNPIPIHIWMPECEMTLSSPQ